MSPTCWVIVWHDMGGGHGVWRALKLGVVCGVQLDGPGGLVRFQVEEVVDLAVTPFVPDRVLKATLAMMLHCSRDDLRVVVAH